MTDERSTATAGITPTMRALRLHAAGGPGELVMERIETPRPRAGEALVRVHAAAITRDELEWPLDRLPAVPAYELSGVVAALDPNADGVSIGEAVYGLTGFDRDGVAADFAAVPATMLAPKPRTLDHLASAAVPLAALSAWQGLFDHGGLEEGQRVVIHGATGGVGHFATQLARWRGAYVIGSTSRGGESARRLGAHEVLDHTTRFEETLDVVDLVFDTVGGELLERSPSLLREGGRLVSVAEAPPAPVADEANSVYFVVEPNREQLVEITHLVEGGDLRPAIDSVFPLAEARTAFERSLARGKRGKVVLQVFDD